MRTNIEIDDKLMKQAMKASGAATKRAVVEEALRLLVKIKGQGEILKWFGKVEWDGDLEAMRGYNKWEEAKKSERAGERVAAKSNSTRTKAA